MPRLVQRISQLVEGYKPRWQSAELPQCPLFILYEKIGKWKWCRRKPNHINLTLIRFANTFTTETINDNPITIVDNMETINRNYQWCGMWSSESMYKRATKETHHVLPLMINSSNIFLLPFIQVEHVHTICPSTCIWVKVPRNVRVGKIEVLVKTVKALPTGFHSSIHFPMKIDRP